MTRPISDIAFTPAVKQAQQDRGSRETYAKVEQRGGWRDRVTPDLAAFIAERDSLYPGTANVDAQPYIQHRGGTKGFLLVFTIEAWDTNCPQHITPRFVEGEAEGEMQQLRTRVRQLQSENARFRLAN